jgi:hypothetical protein
MLLYGAGLAAFALLVVLVLIVSAVDWSRAADVRDRLPDPIGLVKNWLWPAPPSLG